jgi:Uma2 family endonuclease
MSTISAPREPSVVLRNIRWETYLQLLEDTCDGETRLTYDRGSLEIMAPMYRHERIGGIFDRYIGILAEELNVSFISAGSTTFKREDLQRGLEPDKCYYFRNVALVAGKDMLDLSIDPPPDLALEVDITHRSLDRISIYAALGVPELWRYENDVLRIYHLGADGNYEEVADSQIFPRLPFDKLVTFVSRYSTSDELTLIRDFRAWVRSDVLPNWKGGAGA